MHIRFLILCLLTGISSYTVIIEGMGNEGSIIRKEGKLLIKDK